MAENLKHPKTRIEGQIQQFATDIEPLVVAMAPKVGINRAFLGRLCDLLPSGTRSAQHLSPEDWAWLAALEQVAHRHGLCYELITRTGEEDTLWLIPEH